MRCIDSGGFRDHQAKILKAIEVPLEAPSTSKNANDPLSNGKNGSSIKSSRVSHRKFADQFAKLKEQLPTFPKARHFVVNVLVVGPPNIGKSSLVMQACFNKFESNHNVDLDVYVIVFVPVCLFIWFYFAHLHH